MKGKTWRLGMELSNNKVAQDENACKGDKCHFIIVKTGPMPWDDRDKVY